MATTPTPFTWPSGPGSVQVSGDWDDWKEKFELKKKDDGSFESDISLPENKRVHYKYIVDGNWTTKAGDPTVDDNGNVNNITDVGPAPKTDKTSSNDTSAGTVAGVGAGAVAVGGGAVAASAAAVKNGKEEEIKKADSAAPSTSATPAAAAQIASTEKKAEPAQPIRDAANSDIRNYIPQSLTASTLAATPVLTSALATVTGADIFRGNPEELPVSPAEAQQVQAQAQKETTLVGNAITDPTKASTDNSKAGANVATTAATAHKLDAPAVAVTDAGHAANVDAARLSAGKEGGEAAGAIASAGLSTSNQTTGNVHKDIAAAPALKPETSGVPAGALPVTSSSASNGKPAAVTESTPAVTQQQKTLPTTPTKPTNGTSATKQSNVTPAKSSASPSTPSKSNTTKDKKGTIRSQLKGDVSEDADTSKGSIGRSEHKRKQSLFGKIKHALSPHSSPSK